jgi:hypothetical protein
MPTLASRTIERKSRRSSPDCVNLLTIDWRMLTSRGDGSTQLQQNEKYQSDVVVTLSCDMVTLTQIMGNSVSSKSDKLTFAQFSNGAASLNAREVLSGFTLAFGRAM